MKKIKFILLFICFLRLNHQSIIEDILHFDSLQTKNPTDVRKQYLPSKTALLLLR